MEHMAEKLTLLRSGNVSLRWLLLQSSGTQRKLKAAVANARPQGNELLTLMLGIAELEHEVRELIPVTAVACKCFTPAMQSNWQYSKGEPLAGMASGQMSKYI